MLPRIPPGNRDKSFASRAPSDQRSLVSDRAERESTRQSRVQLQLRRVGRSWFNWHHGGSAGLKIAEWNNCTDIPASTEGFLSSVRFFFLLVVECRTMGTLRDQPASFCVEPRKPALRSANPDCPARHICYADIRENAISRRGISVKGVIVMTLEPSGKERGPGSVHELDWNLLSLPRVPPH